MPEHRVYVEPFGGAGSVLFAKSRAYCEVWNDLDDNLYNLFWVMQNHHNDLADALRLTPFSRREFEMASREHPNPVERARRLIIRSFMGFGADSASDTSRGTGFRSTSNKSGTTPAHDWVNYEAFLYELIDRLRGVIIECREASEVMRQHDSETTLFYLDPPYLESTRKRFGAYRHELSNDQHLEILQLAKSVKGHVMISSYQSELYEQELAGWRKETKAALADGAAKRTECLWIKSA